VCVCDRYAKIVYRRPPSRASSNARSASVAAP
jgi:hypothetical protein